MVTKIWAFYCTLIAGPGGCGRYCYGSGVTEETRGEYKSYLDEKKKKHHKIIRQKFGTKLFFP